MVSDNKPDIWRLQAQFDTQGLIRALQSADAGIRKRAAAALRALDAKEAIPALQRAYMNEKHAEAKANIFSALESMTDNPALLPDDMTEAPSTKSEVELMIEQLSSSTPQKVIDAAQKLGELQDKLAVEPLVMIFNDSRVSIQVRLAVAEALLKLESAPVEVALLAALRHSDWKIRRNGAAILGQLKAAWAVEPLAKAVRDSHPVVRRTAYAALKHIGTPEARQALGRGTVGDTKSKRPAGMPSRATPNKKKGTGSLLDRVSPSPDQNEATNSEKQNLSWPKRGESDAEIQRHIQPTKPLDPRTVEEIERRRKQQNKPPTNNQRQGNQDK